MQVLHNGRILVLRGQGSDTEASFTDCLAIHNGLIEYIGTANDLPDSIRSAATETVNLLQRIVTPGFVDGHMHLLLLGQSLTKVDLIKCKNVQEVQDTIRSHIAANPDVERVMCKGWLEGIMTEPPHRTMLDAVDETRPIFIDSNGLHSTWCNTTALRDLGVEDLPDPVGGKIVRDAQGKATGVVTEAVVFSHVWPYLSKVTSLDDRVAAMQAAIDAYTAEGYTGMIEMAMDEYAWEAVQVLFTSRPPPPIRISAHWLIRPLDSLADTLAQIDRAIALHAQHNDATTPYCRLVGIKLILDGTVDTCTAALASSYGGMTDLVPPFWSRAFVEAVVDRAARAGLQCALHAIGDATASMAIDVLAALGQPLLPSRRLRHRIEHLEVTTDADAARLGRAGITASIQPLHGDPAALKRWPALLGKERTDRAFAYRAFEAGGAVLAIGSDAPTAPFAPLKELYVATTRKSVREPGLAALEGHEALSLASAVAAATRGAAWSCGSDGMVGTLEVGKRADLAVLDVEWTPEGLYRGRVEETWFNGLKVWQRVDA